MVQRRDRIRVTLETVGYRRAAISSDRSENRTYHVTFRLEENEIGSKGVHGYGTKLHFDGAGHL